MQALQDMRQAMERVSPLTDAVWAEVSALASVREVRAGEHLLRAGIRAERIFFVRSGLLREVYVDAAGRESTRQFSAPGEFSGSLADLLSGEPAAVSIEVLDAGIVLQAPWTPLDRLADAHPSLMKLLRRVAETLYLRKTRREFEMLTLTAAERYARFAAQYPALDARLHRQQVASYLGITPVHLSRIRAAAARIPRETPPQAT